MMPTPPMPQYRYALMPLFFIAAAFIVLGPTFWNGTETRQGSVAEAYENSDLYQFMYPAFDYGYSRMRARQVNGAADLSDVFRVGVPLWNSRQHCGTPFYTDARIGLYQPLNAVFLFLPIGRAMAVHAFLSLFLMGLFFALFARALGVGYVPALIGGIVYAFCGASAAAMSRPWMAVALTWIPFVMWAVREYGYRFDYGTAVLAGLGGAMLVLSGAYAVVLAALCLIVPYRLQMSLFPFSDEPQVPPLSRRIKGLVLMGLVAVGVSAIQWLPTLLWALHLDRPGEALWNFNVAAEAPVTAREMLAQVLTPESSTLPRIAYIGTVPLLLIPAALFHRYLRRDGAFFVLAAVVFSALALSVRPYLPLEFPRLAFIYPATFSLAALSAIGADRLIMPRSTYRSRPVWLPASAVLILAGIFVWAFGAGIRQYVIPFTVILIPFLLLRFRWTAFLCGVLIALLIVIDLTVASKNTYRHPRQDAPACYLRYEPALEDLREQSLGARAMVSARDLATGLSANAGMIYPIHMVGGTLLPLTRDQAIWWTRLAGPGTPFIFGSGKDVTWESPAPVLLNFMAARAILASPRGALYAGGWGASGPRLREVPTQGGLRLYVNDDAMPRAYWVPAWRVTVGTDAAIDALTDPSFDATRECVVDALSQGIGTLAAGAPSGKDDAPRFRDATCSIEELAPELITVRVNAPAPGITVLADTHAPGWTATVNGERKPILKVNGLFRGITTPAGPSVIEFHYRPSNVIVGRTLALASLMLTLLFGLRALFRRG